MKENTVKRENWSSRLGFLVSCIGSAVGMGNIWLFPSRVAQYGGAFLLAYLFFNLTIGICGLIGEMSFGRKARAGSMGAFARAAQARGKKRWGSTVGLLPTVTSFLLAVSYAVVISWILRYVALSFFIQGSVGPWMDLLSIYLCPLGAALAAIFFAWVWGKKTVVSQLGEGWSSRLAGFYGYYKYVFVTGTLLIWILGILLGGIG